MYRVMIADDEQIIRDGVAHAIAWQTLGMELTEPAEDGIDALEKAKKYRPDIVITDIKMPRMDGLEFVRKLQRLLPECKIIILSGHGEFGYARTALQLGVNDYLLKPVSLLALYETVAKTKEALDREHFQKKELTELQKRAQEERILRQQIALRRYTEGRAQWEAVREILPAYCGSAKFTAGILVQIDDFDRLTESMDEEAIFLFTCTLEKELIAQRDEEICVTPQDMGRYFVVFFGDCAEELEFQMRLFIRRLRMANLVVSFTTISSSVQKDASACRKCLEEAKQCMNKVFLLGVGQDISAKDESSEFGTALPQDINMKEMIQVLSGFKKEKIRAYFEQISENIRKNTCNSYLYTSMLVGFIYGEMIKLLTEMQYPISGILPDPMGTYHRLMACQSLDAMMEQLLEILDKICAFVEYSGNATQDTVERAKLYIREHYDQAKLSLEMVAAQVNISSTYLSALFKQYTGESFVSYLTRVRLEHAQRLLLAGDYKSYEVAHMCGYENTTYFSTIFKRFVGVSPSGYRKYMGEESANR